MTAERFEGGGCWHQLFNELETPKRENHMCALLQYHHQFLRWFLTIFAMSTAAKTLPQNIHNTVARKAREPLHNQPFMVAIDKKLPMFSF